MRRGAWIYVGLLGLAFVVTLGAQEVGSDSPLPSVHNRGPRGLAVLATWLVAAGAEVIAHDGPLTELPGRAASVVLVAPAGDEVREAEVEALLDFARRGGTAVVLLPRGAPQPALRRALEAGPGPTPPLMAEAADVGGTTVAVRFAAGLLDGSAALRLAADRMLDVRYPGAVPVVEHGALWWAPEGAGELWLGAGADLAENARLELADNAAFWSRLAARGPVVFDEYHHHRGSTRTPTNLPLTAAQLVLCGLLFVWVRGTRLGPPRDEPPALHRSSLEYVDAMAGLIANAQPDAELAITLRTRIRALLHERLGIPLHWPWAQAAAEAARRAELDAAALLRAEHNQDVLELTQVLARAEAALPSRR